MKKNVRTVGLDYLNIDDPLSTSFAAHRLLLGHHIPIIEGLDLSRAPEGHCFFSGLPLRIQDGEASPIRALLYQETAH